MMNPLPMLKADIRANLGRSILILVLLALAFSGAIAVSSFERGFRGASAGAAKEQDLLVAAAGSEVDLVLATVYLRQAGALPLLDRGVVEELERDPRVAASSPLVLADRVGAYPVVGVGPRFAEIRRSLRVAQGSWPAAPFEAAIGASVDLALGELVISSHGSVDQAAGAEERHDRFPYRVVARLKSTGTAWDRAIITPMESIFALHGGLGSEGVAAVLVKPRGFAEAYSLRADYRRPGLMALFPAEVLGKAFALLDDLKSLVSTISSLVLAFLLLAVILALLASMPSKERWIGLLRALGAGRGYIFATLWIQAAFTFALAGLLGLLLGQAGALGLAAWTLAQTGLAVSIGLGGPEFALFAAFILASFLGATLPAVAGFRMSTRRALGIGS